MSSADGAPGDWGGLTICGNAPTTAGDDAQAEVGGFIYGGSNAADNSGSINYLVIKGTGAQINSDSQYNGISLYAVGSGTTISNVSVINGADDGIEFFGGTVNASNLLVWAQGDDALDIDQAYSGTIDNALVILGDFSDHAFEIDGPEGSATGSFTLQNATIIGNTTTENGEYADYRSGATGTTNNIYAYGFKASSDIELDNDGVATNYNDGQLIFGIWELVLPEGVTDVNASNTHNRSRPVTTASMSLPG